ncbi:MULTISPECIES: Sec-independent protein translocase protein TatB [unclassified Pseudomonas]|uniref:Sec-independent protein translocase protein TatB n=1 Tax=unclassified Pseudomonas TaxID=196821 RepID=UPI002AC8C4D7|nr:MULTISPECIES: Sec-independent protein translocase protein TatB [unclassified Pseudomonas]MEB0042170.1 Sec-independent protein translocase protein TatB [Pseudomonas sp. MH10]MEB0076931.1 Sec-independent protein translocase protein TatB [Pseudomonas sp. MH10out]MEB0102341.1 Sec-independent protein translocase protein TatB [Pseudomonas sp. CCI3.2]MEB0129629.1 Sec-independent protein translocase protein TatB [Pseudomonas sp. CCI2.4]MEB0156571.1 Sec-independent protein translocase protein TatB [
MFGISFSELLLVGLVALLVLGPERLPGAARTAGLWIGRLKRSFNAIKQEVEREIGADEIRRQLHNEHIMSLEEDAKKIFAPLQPPQQMQAEPVATISPSAEAHSIAPPTASVVDAPLTAAPLASPEAAVVVPSDDTSMPTATATPAAHVSPVPSEPSANDSTLPPRAP